jgi:hypothetical protein
MDNTHEQASKHQSNTRFGIDPRPTIIEAIAVGDFVPEPR